MKYIYNKSTSSNTHTKLAKLPFLPLLKKCKSNNILYIYIYICL